MRILFRLSRPFGIQMAELVLLGGNLDQQALAQIAGAHAGRVEMLHQVDAAAHQLERRGMVLDRRPPAALSSSSDCSKAAASSSSLAAR